MLDPVLFDQLYAANTLDSRGFVCNVEENVQEVTFLHLKHTAHDFQLVFCKTFAFQKVKQGLTGNWVGPFLAKILRTIKEMGNPAEKALDEFFHCDEFVTKLEFLAPVSL